MHYVFGITEYSQFGKTKAKWQISRRELSKSKQLVVTLVNSALCTLAGLCSATLQFVVQLFCGIFTVSALNVAITSHVAARNPLCSLMTSDNIWSSSVVIGAKDRGVVVQKTFYYHRNFLTHIHVPTEPASRGAGLLEVPCEVFSGRKGRVF